MVRRWSLALLVFLLLSHTAVGAIFTTKTGYGNLDDPSSFGAREIYRGLFRINGQEAEMMVLSGKTGSIELFTNLVGNPDGRKDLHYQKSSGGTIVGLLGEGASERRFLITPVGSDQTCIIFVLKSRSEIPTRNGKETIPWPKSLPVLDSSQQPQLVVEHLDNDFIFTSVSISGDANPERVLLNSRQRLLDDGWTVEPMTDKVMSELPDSKFAVLGKNSKICWLEARAGTLPNQVLITLLCKKP